MNKKMMLVLLLSAGKVIARSATEQRSPSELTTLSDKSSHKNIINPWDDNLEYDSDYQEEQKLLDQQVESIEPIDSGWVIVEQKDAVNPWDDNFEYDANYQEEQRLSQDALRLKQRVNQMHNQQFINSQVLKLAHQIIASTAYLQDQQLVAEILFNLESELVDVDNHYQDDKLNALSNLIFDYNLTVHS